MGLVALLLAAAAALLAAATAPASAAGAFSEVPPATPCTAAIVSIAPCLAHVALVAPPARPAPAPTEACCAAFLRGVSPSGGGEGCFCHLLRDPLLLGFPVNTARLGALLPTCAAANANASAAATVEAATLFANTCRDLKLLPEMRFLTDPPPTPTISPAAVPRSTPPPSEARSTSVPVPPQDWSGSETSTPCWIFLVVLLALTAAAAADLIQL